ncbi:hypothetical protein K4K56_002440 [Colletotrichum sp. SAR 10_98]|nr:hypothetical protein K4K56_002440 [Colletotrichum sp. SAR 10_98]
MESLLSAHYGYDVGDARDKMQVLSDTQKWLGKEILHVARMKSLLIGPDFHGKEYYSYIKHDFSFAELIARITNLTSLEDFDLVEDTKL